MASPFEIRFLDREFSPRAAHLALDEIERLEELFSFFKENSELNRVNRSAGGSSIGIGEELFEILTLARSLWKQTGGAFDVTASPLWRLWGFHRRQGARPPAEAIAECLCRVGSEGVSLDALRGEVSLSEGVEINLGSIGKGFALDRALEVLRRKGIETALLHSGWSTILAAGGLGRKGWKVAVSHPARRSEAAVQVHIKDRALATSGGIEQSFEEEGICYSHVLDPRTGQPRRGLWSSSVIAESAARADALATAFAVMSVDAIAQFCDEHRKVGALLMEADENGELKEMWALGDGWEGMEVLT